jgi:hypothetical protein
MSESWNEAGHESGTFRCRRASSAINARSGVWSPSIRVGVGGVGLGPSPRVPQKIFAAGQVDFLARLRDIVWGRAVPGP